MVAVLDTRIHPWVAEGVSRARFGIATTMLPDWTAIRDLVQTIEGLGFDSLWLPDHPAVLGYNPWTALTAVALATESIRIGPLVACAAYWNPAILARSAADLDRISGGRLVLGLGSGDMPGEFAQLGLPWRPAPQRQAMLEETLRIVAPLLQGDTVTYHGEWAQANDMRLDPPPVQPHVPILVAGGGERTTLRFVAQYGDASSLGAVSWAGGAFTPDDARHKFAVLQSHCEAQGRPPEAILRTGLQALFLSDSPDALAAKMASLPPFLLPFFENLPVVGRPEEAVPRLQAMLDAGFQYLIFIVLPFDTETLHLLAERVLPALETGRRAVKAGGPAALSVLTGEGSA